ncbi:serine hydrolase domain-containing protein [Ornithinibacillus halotolerans]|uniref:Penicillin-binding protein n=1 Tax=Ornithinibacillus halotolerans TaxID=1274357 RepID=A0A916SA70_9BACI|nr:serine hydrolase [Ornithinibacillus halotolerans]GGA89346.1 penicillin-binding protein [Ornithinibacillus halotolerans]
MTAFKELTAYTEKVKNEIHASGSALVIMKNNQIVHEWYSGRHHFESGAKAINEFSRFNVYSVRVTYVSLAIAIAIYEGDIGLEDKLSTYLTEYDSEILGNTTIRHLLTRSTGLKFSKTEVKQVFDVGTNLEGKRPEILAKILFQATGKTLNEILSKHVFQPLEWKSTGWVTEGNANLVGNINSKEGYPTLRLGSNIGDDRNLYVSARELAYWGNLHLQKGFIDGKQILPMEVFDFATTIQSPNSFPKHLPKFGFLWWIKDGDVSVDYNELGADLPEGSYQILGASGCSCTVIPKYNTVAVRMYNRVNASESGFDYVRDIQTFDNLIVSSIKKL